MEFWGGDLHSLSTQIDYIAELGADALDFMEISPEYGTRSDFGRLAEQVRGHGMKLVMEGVFNHMGCNLPGFRRAELLP